MKSKKVILSLLFVLVMVIIYLILYNKTYHIKVNTDNIYEIQVKTSDADGLNTKTITNVDEIKDYMDDALNMKFTHPKFNTGKGWVTSVDIKMRKKDGSEWIYGYTLFDDRINIGSIQYKIISQ
ncbi:hypothetical protein QA584_14945 [Anaerocolumna sp. AGMB13025]|uniref:hypothetical protein n=1 Tax=Anaerocolumna sp. AGMB13025 TaxID=3039116 RepID=UPI00241F22EA|nr:hypothetical protein [Anaerocolumna sp. AGMB13025]WFR54914.1 hypothetical protein QA584_14945 [Anaerocolumna sp. AGMB13025]